MSRLIEHLDAIEASLSSHADKLFGRDREAALLVSQASAATASARETMEAYEAVLEKVVSCGTCKACVSIAEDALSHGGKK